MTSVLDKKDMSFCSYHSFLLITLNLGSCWTEVMSLDKKPPPATQPKQKKPSNPKPTNLVRLLTPTQLV